MWRQRVIVAIRGSPERARSADKWTCDDSSHAHPAANQVEGDPADPVLLGDRNDVLVRGYLEHAVGGRIDDRLAGPHVLGSQPIDYLGSRRDDIPNRAAP